MGQDGTAGERPGQAERLARVELAAGAGAPGSAEAVVTYGGKQLRVHGRALRLILWVVSHQLQINEVAAERGQLWLTWKGSGSRSIEGNLKVPLQP